MWRRSEGSLPPRQLPVELGGLHQVHILQRCACAAAAAAAAAVQPIRAPADSSGCGRNAASSVE